MSPLVASWRRGEGSQAQIAARAGMPTPTLAWWCQRLGRTPAPSSAFVAVDLAPEAAERAGPGGFEVVLPRGRCVRVPPDFDAGALSRLLSVLERPC
jgi:hypothetical protein